MNLIASPSTPPFTKSLHLGTTHPQRQNIFGASQECQITHTTCGQCWHSRWQFECAKCAVVRKWAWL